MKLPTCCPGPNAGSTDGAPHADRATGWSIDRIPKPPSAPATAKPAFCLEAIARKSPGNAVKRSLNAGIRSRIPGVGSARAGSGGLASRATVSALLTGLDCAAAVRHQLNAETEIQSPTHARRSTIEDSIRACFTIRRCAVSGDCGISMSFSLWRHWPSWPEGTRSARRRRQPSPSSTSTTRTRWTLLTVADPAGWPGWRRSSSGSERPIRRCCSPWEATSFRRPRLVPHVSTENQWRGVRPSRS